MSIREELDEGVGSGATGRDGDPDCRRRCFRDELGIGDRAQLDEPHPIWVAIGVSLRCRDRQTGLAGTTVARQRDQPRPSQHASDLAQLMLTANEGRQLHRPLRAAGCRRRV